jgi:hypothetical protein
VGVYGVGSLRVEVGCGSDALSHRVSLFVGVAGAAGGGQVAGVSVSGLE